MKLDLSRYARAIQLRLEVEATRQGRIQSETAQGVVGEVLGGLDRVTAGKVVEAVLSEAEISSLGLSRGELEGMLHASTQKLPLQVQLKALASVGADSGAATSHLKAVIRGLAADGAKNRYFVDDRLADGFDLEQIKTAQHFTMHLDAPGAEDAIVAAGVALARQIPSLYLVRTRKDLPWFLREIEESHPGLVRVVESKDIDGLLDTLASHGKDLVSFPPSGPRLSPSATDGATDTFIGCLMSGLTEAQYAEGRSHLLAIDAALEALGSPKNHCEGIQVETTASFGSPKESLVADLAAIREAKRCVFYQYDDASRPSGMWVEAGVALGLDKPCQFLVPHDRGLPPGLAQAIEGGKANGAGKLAYGSHTNLLSGLSGHVQSLLG